jgi:hypothetical protein
MRGLQEFVNKTAKEIYKSSAQAASGGEMGIY